MCNKQIRCMDPKQHCIRSIMVESTARPEYKVRKKYLQRKVDDLLASHL